MSKKQSKSSKSRSDVAVQGTNDNSIVSKHSMASLGYFNDEFLQYVVAKKQRRAPLINRGYYIRAKVINHMLTKFLNAPLNGRKKQIISLGAGFDTAYFRLKSQGLLENCVFVEIDFADVVKRKAESINNQEGLKNLLDNVQESKLIPQIVINSPGYKLLGIDLTDLQTLQACMKACNIDDKVPTVLLSECVITYMSAKNSSKLIDWCSGYFENAAFITYEQIKPYDAFGRIMCAHFKKMGSPLRGISTYPSIETQEERYRSLGWEQCFTSDMNTFFNSLPKEERDRVAALELFDEFEEWHLKCAHYIVLTAEKGDCKGIYGTVDNTNTPPASIEFQETSRQTMTIKESNQVSLCLQRVGHACAVVNDVAVVTGGFGSSDGKHKRQKDILAIDVKTGERVELIIDDSYQLVDERMFHTATNIGNGAVLIFGGRTSPSCALNTGLLLKLTFNHQTLSDYENMDPGNTSECGGRIEQTLCNSGSENCIDSNASNTSGKDCEQSDVSVSKGETDCSSSATRDEDGSRNNTSVCLKCETLHMTGDVPTPRWRHTASYVEILGQPKVILFGGRNPSRSLGDMYVLDVQTFIWEKVDMKGTPPSPRHSHSATVWNKTLLVSGGIDEDLQPFNSVFSLDTITMIWKQMDWSAEIIPRYSHTSHVIDDKLLLIGGIMPSVHSPIAVTSIDLMDGTVIDYAMPLPAPGCDVPHLMLHNHCSIPITEDGRNIMILGGGGNCFSFGTHLNSTPVHVML